MTQPRKEQINIRRAYWTVFTYTATGGTTSTVIAAATLQPSTITQIPGGDPTTSPPTRGIITTGTGGFVRLRKVDSALSLDDVGAQIYGRLTFSAGNYTITYKKISGGVEVSATLPSVGPYSVEMLLPEVMDFAEIPANADIIYGSFQELLPSGNTIAGDLVVAGNTTLGDASSDTITLNARFISDLIPTPDNTRSLGSSSLRWADGHFTQISLRADNTNTVKSIYNSAGITATGTAFTIDGNSSLNFGTSTTTGITIGRVGITTVINGSLNPTGAVTVGGVLTVNGSPSVFNGDVNITGTLTVGNISFVDLTVSGNTILGDDATVDSVDFGSRVISSFVPKFSDSYDLGQTGLRWRALHSTRVVAHSDDTGSIYSLLDSDSLFSTVPFDIDGYGTIFIGATHSSGIQIGCITSWPGSGYPDLPNGGGVSFAIDGYQVGSTVTAPNLDTLTNGSDAVGLHTHLGAGSYFLVATSGTITANYGNLIACDPTGGGFTVNLPTALGNPNKTIVIKNVTSSTNAITIDAFGSELIDGMGTQTISIGYQALTLYSDGAGWMII